MLGGREHTTHTRARARARASTSEHGTQRVEYCVLDLPKSNAFALAAQERADGPTTFSAKETNSIVLLAWCANWVVQTSWSHK